MKQWLAILLVLVLAVGCFAGCTEKAKASDKPAEVETPTINNGVTGFSSDSDAANESEEDSILTSSDSDTPVEEETQDIYSSSSDAG